MRFITSLADPELLSDRYPLVLEVGALSRVSHFLVSSLRTETARSSSGIARAHFKTRLLSRTGVEPAIVQDICNEQRVRLGRRCGEEEEEREGEELRIQREGGDVGAGG